MESNVEQKTEACLDLLQDIIDNRVLVPTQGGSVPLISLGNGTEERVCLGNIPSTDGTHRLPCHSHRQTLGAQTCTLTVRAGLLAHELNVVLASRITACLHKAAPDLRSYTLPGAVELAMPTAIAAPTET